MEKLVIAGTGPAGFTAAIYAARANLSPVVIEGMQPGGQLTTTTEVENYPGFPHGIQGPELMEHFRAQATRFGTRFIRDEVVGAKFEEGNHRLILSDGREIAGKTVIISTGASALYLGIDSEKKLMGRGVTACATCDGAFYRNQDVAVIGGGDTAMEEATFLSRICSKVTIIHRRDSFRASKIMAERVMTNPKIEIRWNSVVEEITDVSKNSVDGVVLRNVVDNSISKIAVTGFFVAIGHRPNTDPFKGQVELDDKGFVKTHHTKTNVAGVFAAGDVQDHEYRQAVTAAGTGCMAALEAERYLSAHNA